MVSIETYKIQQEEIMNHVRTLRDRFVKGVLDGMSKWEDHFLKGKAQFVDTHQIEVDGRSIKADKFIIATGSRPNYPSEWKDYESYFIDTNQIFELEKLPEKILVAGLG